MSFSVILSLNQIYVCFLSELVLCDTVECHQQTSLYFIQQIRFLTPCYICFFLNALNDTIMWSFLCFSLFFLFCFVLFTLIKEQATAAKKHLNTRWKTRELCPSYWSHVVVVVVVCRVNTKRPVRRRWLTRCTLCCLKPKKLNTPKNKVSCAARYKTTCCHFSF